MKPDCGEPQRLDVPAALDKQFRAGPKPLLRKIGLEIDDHLAADAVGTRDASHESHIAPNLRHVIGLLESPT
jgi:hypothetical protein